MAGGGEEGLVGLNTTAGNSRDAPDLTALAKKRIGERKGHGLFLSEEDSPRNRPQIPRFMNLVLEVWLIEYALEKF